MSTGRRVLATSAADPFSGSYRPRRHRWNDDVCRACGVRRHGYGGGRTGELRYYNADGTYRGSRAGTCA